MIKPILFNIDMVRAILEDRKTVTRRVVKHGRLLSAEVVEATCVPPYRPGDILYVRETWAAWSRVEGIPPALYYKADRDAPDGIKWRPSIHMPREAARIFLRVTDVRVEKLQDIKPEQLRAEGFHLSFTPSECQRMFDRWGAVQNFEREKEKFASLWNSTIKKADLATYGWEANPWAWVIEFELISREEAMQNV